MHDVIYTAVCLHNDFAQSGEALFSDLKIKHIDFGCVTDIFFWDENFLISSDIFDNLLPDAKRSLNFSEETFGVVHGLKPHPEEVKLKAIKIPKGWESSDIYKAGEDYPFIGEDV